jgi:DNA-damage-inducible protein J
VCALIRITLTRVAKDHALPFELKIPNAATRAAMEESRAITFVRAGTHSELFE